MQAMNDQSDDDEACAAAEEGEEEEPCEKDPVVEPEPHARSSGSSGKSRTGSKTADVPKDAENKPTNSQPAGNNTPPGQGNQDVEQAAKPNHPPPPSAASGTPAEATARDPQGPEQADASIPAEGNNSDPKVGFLLACHIFWLP